MKQRPIGHVAAYWLSIGIWRESVYQCCVQVRPAPGMPVKADCPGTKLGSVLQIRSTEVYLSAWCHVAEKPDHGMILSPFWDGQGTVAVRHNQSCAKPQLTTNLVTP